MAKRKAPARKSSRSASRSTGRSAKKTRARAKSAPRKTAKRAVKARKRAGASTKVKARTTSAGRSAVKRRLASAKPAAAQGAKKKTTRTAKSTRPVRPAKAAPRRVPAPAARATRPAAAKPPLSSKAPRRRPVRDESEEPLVETPTSFNLDLRRARTAEVALEQGFDRDPNSAEALAAGDRDVTLESAATVGDETPGGDNPTPDMDVVDLIGRSLGVEYQDNEELKGAEKIAKRDRQRWELNPKSAEDYKERRRK